MSRTLLGGLALAMLAACTPDPSTSSTPRPAVRSDLILAMAVHAEDPSLLVAQYRAWDPDGQLVPDIELDHGHGPAEEDTDEDTVVLARAGGEALPVQATDADGDRVLVDLDALPMGRQTLRLVVIHDGLRSDELAVSVLDRRLATP